MNLWVKRTGQLLLAALFLMSCEDDSFLLGFKNQNKKFNVGYQEFLLGEGVGITSKVISIDSIITDNYSGTPRLLVGEYTDPVLGSVRAESFVEFLPVSQSKLDNSTTLDYVFDSLVFQMRLDYYSYGLVNEGVSKFNIYKLSDTVSYRKDVILKIKNSKGVLVDSLWSLNGANRYYANSTVGYGELLREVKLVKSSTIAGSEKISNATLKLSRLEARQDTLLARTRLPDDYGLELFGVAKDDPNSEFTNDGKFRSRFKGFALVPSESNAVVGYGSNSSLSRLILYYHSTENGARKDTLSTFFYPSSSFHNITATRTAEFPSSDPVYVGTVPGSGLRAIQNGNPMISKIDINKFYTEFADTIESEILLNSAEVLVQSVEDQDGYTAIPNLELRVMKEENDRYLDYRIDEDSAFVSGNSFLFPSNRHYYVIGDREVAPVFLPYSSTKDKYSGFATFFFQNLLEQVRENKKTPDTPKPLIRYLGLYPSGEMGKSINRSVFDKGNIKLRIYYTYPNKENQ